MTSWALLVNLRTFVEAEQWVLAPLDAIIFVLAMWLIVEAGLALRTAFRERPDVAATTGPSTAPPSVVSRANPTSPSPERPTGEPARDEDRP
jgi:carbon starvation protein